MLLNQAIYTVFAQSVIENARIALDKLGYKQVNGRVCPEIATIIAVLAVVDSPFHCPNTDNLTVENAIEVLRENSIDM